MKFKITCDNSVYYYDNWQNIFYDQFKNYLNLRRLDPAQQWFRPKDNFESLAYVHEQRLPNKERYVDLSQLYHVKFQLGLNCNYKCLYCSQRICGNYSEHINLDLFKRNCKQCKLDWSKVKAIEFWGGEPFVYWKYIKELPKFFREELGFNGFFHMTTNVDLFDDEKYEWSLENNVHYMFSHDGVNHKQQRSLNDWIDDEHKCKLVRSILDKQNESCIHCVFAPMYNTNLWDTLELFYNRIGANRKILLNTGMRCDSTNQYLMAHFTPDKIQQLKQSWYEVLIECHNVENKYYSMLGGTRNYVHLEMLKLLNSRLAGSFVHNCPTKSKHSLYFTMDGHYIPCHGSSLKQGLSAGDMLHLEECRDFGYRSLHSRELCTVCPYISTCGGPCGFYNDRSAIYFCKSTMWNHETTFKACFYLLTGDTIKSVEPLNKEFFDD